MSKSEMKRKAIQKQHDTTDYEKDLVGCFVDPPEGWRYGFPDVYDGTKPFRDWIESKGYPMKNWDTMMSKYVRVWKETK